MALLAEACPDVAPTTLGWPSPNRGKISDACREREARVAATVSRLLQHLLAERGYATVAVQCLAECSRGEFHLGQSESW